jgi:hypothetical protein
MSSESQETNETRAAKARLADLLKQKRRKRGLRDLHFFNRHILEYKDMTDEEGFHAELCREVANKKNRKNLVLMPRGGLKSSCITIGYSLRSIIRNPDIRILICSEQFLTAKKFLAEIKGHIEHNDTFKATYGDLMGKSKWADAEIIVSTRKKYRKEPTITCAGIDVTKVGLHYDMIIVDDPHSESNITSAEQIEKVKKWYKLLLSLLDPGGKLIVIGTRWHYGDLFGWLIEQERIREEAGLKPRFHILKKKAFSGTIADLREGKYSDEDFLWKDRLSPEFLMDTLIDQGPYIFSCQYLNEPVDDESAVFKKSWLRFYGAHSDLPSNLKIYAAVDPMRDEKGADFAVIATVGVDERWRSHILEIRRGKWDENDTIDEIFRCYKRWGHIKIGFEATAWQHSYYKFMKAEMHRRGMRIPIIPLKPSTRITKRMRVRGMVPYWASGLFLLPGRDYTSLKGNVAILADELLRYPLVTNDDCVDALAMTDMVTKRPTALEATKHIPRGSFEHYRQGLQKKKKKGLGAESLIGV